MLVFASFPFPAFSHESAAQTSGQNQEQTQGDASTSAIEAGEQGDGGADLSADDSSNSAEQSDQTASSASQESENAGGGGRRFFWPRVCVR
jgi:hypothetical protein